MSSERNDLYRVPASFLGRQLPLLDLASWENGFTFKKSDFSDSGIPIIKISELNNGIGTATSFAEKNFPESAFIKKDDILFSWSGNPHTSIDVFKFSLDKGWLNQHIFKVTPHKEIVDDNYFYYLMKYLKPHFVKIATNKQTTGLGHITKSDLKRISVDVPDKKTQKRITGILKPIDDKIQINSRINDYLAA